MPRKNKIFSRKIIVLLLLSVLIFNCAVSSACALGTLYKKNQKDKNTVVKGQVIGRIGKNSENSIVGASVRIYTLFGKKLSGSAVSVENGKYEIIAKLDGFYYLTATSINYYSASKLAYFRKGNTYNVDLKLSAKSPIPNPSEPPANPNNAVPVITSITPESNGEFLAGTKIKITINASDADNDSLQYKFSIGNTTKQNWSASNTYQWQTSPADKGAVGVTCEASDNKGGKAYQTITCKIIDPSPEDVLQKLSENHTKIYDFSADMFLNVTLNGEALDKPQYCRYYFKAPQKTTEHKSESKEKTETFEDSARMVKTDIIIIDGTKMSFISPKDGQVKTVDILEETGVNPNQVNQMDVYYDTVGFLAGHTVVKNAVKSDFDKKLICLEAIPKEKNNAYTKLELVIDYDKGVLVKNTLYNKDPEDPAAVENWVQTLETTESLQMPNGAWLPVKMTKIPNLSSGKMESKLEYSNLKVNTGLKDEDFDPQKQL